ncbi:hypothetical protein TELCIR_16887 [Teladorsagia circumcincta]|uniref:Uncharacterized protein n=1 Tax=Teladorsagia circumcincta TaxID=45464 RepID=A0A2G9TUI9_TELCI|nr:hypothetical protein TELCIR_16887 [Teladorsagia circumcincta]
MSPSGAHDGEAKLKTSDRPLSAFTMTVAEAKSDIPHAKPMLNGNNQPSRGLGFHVTCFLGNRRAAVDDVNPFEEIATRAPPRDEVQMQRLRYYIRRQRKPKKKRRRNFLTRNDIYDPQRNQRARMTTEERKKFREELALKPTSDEAEEGSAVKTKEILEEQPDPTTRRALHTGGRISQKDSRTTPEPNPLPTLIPTVDRLPRLQNNPFRSFDISKPTVIALPIPPFIEEEFEGRE